MVNLTQTFPLVTQIISLRQNDSLSFRVAIRSEDEGERLIGLLFLDYSLSGEQLLETGELLPGTFDDLNRKLLMTWTVPTTLRSGCHQLTMLITHRDNLTAARGTLEPISQSDVALATWWVNVNPSASNPDALGVCPKLESSP